MSKVEERDQISLMLHSHPSLILLGPPLTGVIRAVEAILGMEGVDPTEIHEACGGEYPDLQIHDGRELGVDDARRIREDSTLCSSRWSRRYTIISHIDRPHYVVTPTLLKLIEEPPSYFSIILTTSNRHGIPPTIFSRSLLIKVAPSVAGEVQWWVRQRGLDREDVRHRCCAGDLDVAARMDVEIVSEWEGVWEAVAHGGTIPPRFPGIWTERFESLEEATQVGCWAALVEMTAPLASRHALWRDLASLALETRNSIQDGYSNKIQINTALIKSYALAVTIPVRVH